MKNIIIIIILFILMYVVVQGNINRKYILKTQQHIINIYKYETSHLKEFH